MTTYWRSSAQWSKWAVTAYARVVFWGRMAFAGWVRVDRRSVRCNAPHLERIVVPRFSTGEIDDNENRHWLDARSEHDLLNSRSGCTSAVDR